MTAGGPTPIFREEAKAETVKCPSCGGPIQRTGFGAITTIACSYCGAELTPESSGALSVLRHVRRQQRASVLPLHLRGRFDGETFEVIGIVWREVTADGKVYPWQEFLLFNPYVGYRYLLHFIYDGHWALGRPLDGAPAVTPGARPTAEFRRQRYRHFQRSNVRTTYVEGEFPWQIAVGDQVVADDFVAPPLGLSIERSNDQDGVDLQFTQMEHLDGAAIYRAFGLAGTPARARQIGMLQPNRWRQGAGALWLSCALLFLVWLAAAIGYSATRERTKLFSGTAAIGEPITGEFALGEPGRAYTLEVSMSAAPLSNAWAYADVLLVPQASEDAVAVGVEVDDWHGVDGGESWHEGSASNSVAIGAVPGDTWIVQVTPQSGNAAGPASPDPNLRYTVEIHGDVVLARYLLLPLAVILGIPLLFAVAMFIFEGARWRNSDYAPES